MHRLFLPLILCSVHTLFAGTPADSAAQTRARIARAYSVDGFDKIAAIKFTFNIQAGENRVKREWTWEIPTNCVTFRGKGPGGIAMEHAYTHSKTDTADTSRDAYVDRRFINDNYWLLFPEHLMTDGNMVVSSSSPFPAPDQARHGRLFVKYEAGGYTPGDSYDLFPGPDGLLTWWIYRRAGRPEQGSAMTWEKHVRLGPIVVCTEHYNPDRTFHLWFTDLAVKLKGSDTWINAQE